MLNPAIYHSMSPELGGMRVAELNTPSVYPATSGMQREVDKKKRLNYSHLKDRTIVFILKSMSCIVSSRTHASR